MTANRDARRIAVTKALVAGSSDRVDDDDRALTNGLRQGHPSAFAAVYDRYHARLYGFLLRLSGDREAAADLFQETWEKLAIHASRLRDDSDLGAWIFTVARNASRNHRRFRALDLARLARTESDVLDVVASRAPSPETVVQGREDVVRLERALAALSFSYREALLLVAVEGMEQDRAAEVVGVSHAAFRQRVSRARDELARKLEDDRGDL